MTSVDDSTLVLRAQTGDQGAFGELVARHEPAMIAIARAYFASEDDARDAVQEAFLAAFRALGQVERHDRFAGWLARITINECLATLRSKSDRLSLADFASSVQLVPRVGQQVLTPSTLAGKTEQAELLKVAIGRLPEDQRVVIMLRYVQHMNYKEIAAYLDVPSSTLRTRAATAKRALKRNLKALGITGG